MKILELSADTPLDTAASAGFGSVLTRRRFLQAAALVGLAGALRVDAAGAAEPAFVDHFDRYAHATESSVTASGVSVWTPTGSVERGERLTVRAISGWGALQIWIHRVGASDDAVWAGRIVDAADIAADWPTGLYLISATPSNGHDAVAFHPFVVTDRTSRAAITVQVPFATYQAYNAWTPDGRPPLSLYDFNSPGGRGDSVLLDRPYDAFDGAGFLFYGDQQLATWLQAEGIEANYISSLDTHLRPELLENTRLFVSNFHDEYWSAQMRDHLEERIGAGMNAAFFGANNVYWQVEFGGSIMACNKVKGGPHGTFRSLGRPESDLLGSLFESYRHPYRLAAADWVVTAADHWAYAGTGLTNGDRIKRLVGYEWDRVPGDQPDKGVTVLGSSPVGAQHHHHATIVERKGQGTVFNAGTNYWPRLLTGGGGWERNDAVQQVTRNLIQTLG